jgi:phospholipid/cholesterol/gamma-HCH transport system substrate-binding protein
MATIKTKFMVGLFVVIGFSLAVVAVVWLGMANYFEKGQYYVAYFDESVQGLDKDSPVKYRGVTIGSVNSIGVAPDANLIQVILKIETDIKLDDSIVAQLKSVGITGIMFVELEKKDTNTSLPVQQIDFPTKYPVISTKPSDIKKFFDSVTDVLTDIKKLDTEAISARIQSTLVKMEQAIDDAQVATLVNELNKTLSGIQTIANEEKWDSILDALDRTAKSIQAFSSAGTQTVADFDATLNHIDTAVIDNDKALAALMADVSTSIQDIDSLVISGNRFLEGTHKDTFQLLRQLKNTLRQYEKAGKHLNRFLEQVAEQPSQLFFGGPSEEEDITNR